jgi:hypothetical protein
MSRPHQLGSRQLCRNCVVQEDERYPPPKKSITLPSDNDSFGIHNICLPTYLSIYLSLFIYLFVCLSIYLWLYSRSMDLGRFFSFLVFYTVGRIPSTGDQPLTRPPPTHKHRTSENIYASSGIRTHDPSVRAGEDTLCLRPRGRPL